MFSLTVVGLDDVRGRGIALTADEAIAIVFQLGHRLSWHIAPPPPWGILLQSNGRVEVRWPHEAEPPTAGAFARLLHDLLPEPGADDRHGVPGGLRVLVARGLGDTPLPPIAGAGEFAAALHRFVDGSDPDAMAARIAAVVHRTVAAAPAVAPRCRTAERRGTGPSVTELRRQLQEADLACYSLLSQLGRTPRAQAPVLRMGGLTKPSRGLAAAAAASERRSAAVHVHVPGRSAAAARSDGPAGHAGRLPIARATRVLAIAVGLLVCVVADAPVPALPESPVPRYAAALPALPVPIALLSAPVPVVADAPPPSRAREPGVRRVTNTRPTADRERQRARRPNRLLRFVKSLFEA